jgi:hypothetical protein
LLAWQHGRGVPQNEAFLLSWCAVDRIAYLHAVAAVARQDAHTPKMREIADRLTRQAQTAEAALQRVLRL